MLDLQELQLLAQLVDDLDILTQKIEKAYAYNDAENFLKSKNEILRIQQKINEMIR